MKNFNQVLCTLSVVCTALPMLAQTGLHFVPLSYDTFTKHGTNCMALGLDRDVNRHSSISFEVQYGFRLFNRGVPQPQQGSYQNASVDYTADPSFIGFQYRSSYLFNEADDATPYLSVLVGVRSAKMVVSNVNVYSSSYNYPDPNWARETTERITVFPVGLRFGYRSPLDGYAGDIFFGIVHQFGKQPWAAPFLDPKDQLAGFTIHLGYAIGMGW